MAERAGQIHDVIPTGAVAESRDPGQRGRTERAGITLKGWVVLGPGLGCAAPG